MPFAFIRGNGVLPPLLLALTFDSLKLNTSGSAGRLLADF
jgi:hypothetical protein